MPTTYCHLSLSWVKQIQSTLLHFISIKSTLISSYCLHLRLVSGFSCTIMDKKLRMRFSSLPNLLHDPPTFLHLTRIIIFCDDYKLWTCPASCSFFVSLKYKYYHQHPVLRHLSLWSPLYVRRWLRNPCKTTGNGYILCEIPRCVRQEFDGAENDKSDVRMFIIIIAANFVTFKWSSEGV
jgi:hypothetical protein